MTTLPEDTRQLWVIRDRTAFGGSPVTLRAAEFAMTLKRRDARCAAVVTEGHHAGASSALLQVAANSSQVIT
jgi:hypothetical protein